ISTQLNWGASYITNDLYKNINTENNEVLFQKKLVLIGRIATVSIMAIALVITSFIDTIDGAARFLIASSAGLGAVLILRWYWSRINIWSEISATIAPIIGFVLSKFVVAPLFERSCNAGNSCVENEAILLFTTLFTTIAWLSVTFLTKPENDETLKKFYQQVEPLGAWNSVREKLNLPKTKSQIPALIACWISAVTLTYSTLFFIGKLIFEEYYYAIINLIIGVISFIILRYFMFNTKIFND
ncbi:MAG TPA: sodium:proline symporter, partial [Vicingus sp.]|nr:sodium:proline symporter [Vicingus sp.]